MRRPFQRELRSGPDGFVYLQDARGVWWVNEGLNGAGGYWRRLDRLVAEKLGSTVA